MSDGSKVLYLRVPVSVHDDVRRVAKHNRRTLTAVASDLLAAGLAALAEQGSITTSVAPLVAAPRRGR